MSMYSECIFLAKNVCQVGSKYLDTVKQSFNEMFTNISFPHYETMHDLIRKIQNIGSVSDAPKSRLSVVIKERRLKMSNKLLASPSKSLQK